MEMNEIITAEAAREIAASTTKPLRRIMKEINRACEDGLTQLSWNIYGMSVTLVKTIKEKLIKLGYKVKILDFTGHQMSEQEVDSNTFMIGSLDVFWG